MLRRGEDGDLRTKTKQRPTYPRPMVLDLVGEVLGVKDAIHFEVPVGRGAGDRRTSTECVRVGTRRGT